MSASSVAVRLEDGSTSTLPVVEGFFLKSGDRSATMKDWPQSILRSPVL